MVNAYRIGSNPVAKPANSNHNRRLAVDMTIINFENKEVKDSDGNLKKIKVFNDLVSVGRMYGVIWLGAKDKPHWSFNGR
ncbi:hypothetical protein [Iodobacter ciconiae]|uniref:Peptidase M15C domain-containing protein n=1 Tax=Iodobacter ciconiae TaxID=2496266 RepID=A0A3S8ZTL3_9NEIS|nr:hypothetical protein [Iodobacter ciconiae]AZN36765.1 hypothetical protein EJO50_09875 [Iodobacter ciconiae]